MRIMNISSPMASCRKPLRSPSFKSYDAARETQTTSDNKLTQQEMDDILLSVGDKLANLTFYPFHATRNVLTKEQIDMLTSDFARKVRFAVPSDYD